MFLANVKKYWKRVKQDASTVAEHTRRSGCARNKRTGAKLTRNNQHKKDERQTRGVWIHLRDRCNTARIRPSRESRFPDIFVTVIRNPSWPTGLTNCSQNEQEMFIHFIFEIRRAAYFRWSINATAFVQTQTGDHAPEQLPECANPTLATDMLHCAPQFSITISLLLMKTLHEIKMCTFSKTASAIHTNWGLPRQLWWQTTIWNADGFESKNTRGNNSDMMASSPINEWCQTDIRRFNIMNIRPTVMSSYSKRPTVDTKAVNGPAQSHHLTISLRVSYQPISDCKLKRLINSTLHSPKP